MSASRLLRRECDKHGQVFRKEDKVDVDGVDWDDALNKSLPRYRMVERKKGGGGWSASRGTSPAAVWSPSALRARVHMGTCACVRACVRARAHACLRAYIMRVRALTFPAAARCAAAHAVLRGGG